MREQSKTKFAPEIAEKMQRATTELRESGIMETALKVGDKMPSFSLPNINERSEKIKRTGHRKRAQNY